MGAFDDLIPGSKQDFGAFGDLVPPEQGDFARGAKVALGQMAPIAKGVVGLAGATAEKAFGEGGLATGIKNWGLRGYTEGMQRLQPLQRETDDVTVAWERAKEGDLGALLDWAQYGIGYAVGQAGEAAGAALLGAGIGTVLAPEVAPVAGAAGAVTGLVAKGAVKQTAVGLIERAVAKEASRIMAESGGRIAAQEAVSTATRSITREIGASGALLTLGMGQELGSIYPEAEAEAARKGEQITGADLARVWASGLAAGGLEGLTDRLGIQAALGRIRVPGAQTRLGAAALTGAGGAAIEGITEAAQTGIERFGAAQEITSPEGMRDIINSAALGAIGGAAIGGGIGAIQGPAESRARSNAAFQAIGAAKSADEAIAAFEQTYEEITVPPDFDAEGAMARLEAQRQRDEQGLRNPSMPDVPREMGAAPAAPSEPQLGPAEPFADRLLSLRSLIEDSRNRQQVRDTLGPVALNDLLYYLSAADNASLPGVTSDRMLQVAETILNRAQIRREERPGVGGKPAQAAIDATAAPAQIPLDVAPTGRIRVDTDGVAVQEIGADAISTADRMRAEQAQGFRFAGPGNLTEATFPTAQQKLLPAPTVDEGAHEAHASPLNDKSATKEQILGGNAELGHTTLPGLDISVENPAGSERVDLKHEPPQWRNTMKDHYGYIRNSTSIDGEHMDVFLKEGTPTDWQGTVFVVDQIDPKTGKPDEHKVMLGYDSVEEAKEAYRRNYAPGWKGMKAISAMPYADFQRWVFNPELTKKPLVPPMAERAQALKPSQQDAIADDGLRLGDARRDLKPLPASERWAAAPLVQRQQWMRDIGRADLASKASIAKWDWLKLSAGMRAALMKTLNQGAGDAQAVRGDAGQVREGRPGGQPSVQRGPEEGGGHLQRETQERPGAAGPVRARPEAGQAPAQVVRSSFERQIKYLRAIASRTGWRIDESTDEDAITLKRTDSDGKSRRLVAKRVTGGKYQIEVAEGITRPKRGVNALNIEGEVTEYSWHRRLEWDGKRSWESNEVFGVLRDYVANNQAKEQPNAAATEQPTERPAAASDRTRDEGSGEPARAQEQEEGAAPQAEVGGAAATPTTQTAATAGASNEAQGQQEEVLTPAAGTEPAADQYARFDALTLERQIRIAETGEVATMRFNAGAALRQLDARERSITKLLDCMKRSAM